MPPSPATRYHYPLRIATERVGSAITLSALSIVLHEATDEIVPLQQFHRQVILDRDGLIAKRFLAESLNVQIATADVPWTQIGTKSFRAAITLSKDLAGAVESANRSATAVDFAGCVLNLCQLPCERLTFFSDEPKEVKLERMFSRIHIDLDALPPVSWYPVPYVKLQHISSLLHWLVLPCIANSWEFSLRLLTLTLHIGTLQSVDAIDQDEC